ncbi:hypothetical protein G7Y89_g14776 [Cudoniella acicularis]|uniref:DUF4470 domain-containing protein n=1 Tax=Cudoniella acicularis TaxID=354080 RepID=A0A8H4QWZ8_9HELO|nr:hypothetical protein G7Y89_g14776 [Cudoniella acicularis]
MMCSIWNKTRGKTSGDIRNVLKTVNAIPLDYKQKCDIINDLETETALRNPIILLLTFLFLDGSASELIIHLWYSAALPGEMYIVSIAETVLPLIIDICDKIKNKPAENIISKVWKFGSSSLRFTFKQGDWMRLLNILELKDTLPIAEARENRIKVMDLSLSEDRQGWLERHWFMYHPYHRLCNKKFRDTGILLPFEHSKEGFNIPNPTLYNTKGEWQHRPNLHFDRIETSNIADDGQLGIAPYTRSPLLKTKEENPRATPLTHFIHLDQDINTHVSRFNFKEPKTPADQARIHALIKESLPLFGQNLGLYTLHDVFVEWKCHGRPLKSTQNDRPKEKEKTADGGARGGWNKMMAENGVNVKFPSFSGRAATMHVDDVPPDVAEMVAGMGIGEGGSGMLRGVFSKC